MKAIYFATTNVKAPFVLVFGHWPDRSALVKNSLINGIQLGQREALECEIEQADKNPSRHMFFYWKSLRSMLWTHKSPDLIEFYPGLISNIRKRSKELKQVQKSIASKKQAKILKNAAIAQTIAEYETKRIAANNDFKDLIHIINQSKMEFEYELAR